MKFINSLFFSCIAILLIFSFTTCAERDNENDPANPNYSVKASANPANGTTITAHEIITITFDDSVNKSSITLGGTMAASAKAIVSGDWISDRKLNISPSAKWNSGSGTLTVSGTHSNGTSPVSGSMSFTIFNGVCVKTSADGGNDGNQGTALAPMLTISAAITKANTLYIVGVTPAQVRIAKGTYDTNSNVISMVEGISLYGGYSLTDWGTQNSTLNESIINDVTTTGADNKTITCPATITTSTFIDNLTIKAGGGDASGVLSAIYCNSGSPTIQNNKIEGGSNTTSATRYGIYCTTSSAKIYNNSIDGKGGNLVTFCYGIYNYNSNTDIYNNNINGGSGNESYGIYSNGTGIFVIKSNTILSGIGASTYSIFIRNFSNQAKIINNILLSGNSTNIHYGIYVWDSSPIIRNNTIISGYSTNIPSNYVYCIWLHKGILTAPSPAIDNNIFVDIFPSHSYTSRGIYEDNANADPVSLRNNNFYNIDTAYWDENTSSRTAAQLNDYNNTTQVSGTSSGNKNVDPVFQNISSNNFNLTSSSPTDVKTGGLNGAYSTENWGYTTDRNGNSHSPLDDSSTTGWSIGAYEFD